ncbi:MAG: glycosyltransferase [Candidatus Hydrogenedens sp.]|nr:glycosyltransferase [Candidatus Hydrogenedens sp.]
MSFDGHAGPFACIIPCYNAGSRVLPVVQAALAETPHVLVVDDGCTDGCLEEVTKLPARIERHPRNRGKGHAILTGLRTALQDASLQGFALLDADGQHDPGRLPDFYQALQAEQADLVIGARVFDGGHVPWRSRFGNQVTARVTRRLLGVQLPDTQCGFRMLSRRFAEDMVAHVAGGRYETEMEMIVRAVRHDFRLASVPIQTIYEAGNKSSHFNKFADSARIYYRLVQAVLRS